MSYITWCLRQRAITFHAGEVSLSGGFTFGVDPEILSVTLRQGKRLLLAVHLFYLEGPL